MKILLRLPNWLGDGVMVTPALDALFRAYPNAEFNIVASNIVCELFKKEPRIKHIYVDSTKKEKSRFLATIKLAKLVGAHDIAITFTNHFYSSFLLYMSGSKKTIGYSGFLQNFMLTNPLKKQNHIHQVESYFNLVAPVVESRQIGSLTLNVGSINLDSSVLEFLESNKVVGFNIGGAYGEAKRWRIEYFIALGEELLKRGFGVILFGSGEVDKQICESIQKAIKDKNLESRLLNLCSKTTLLELAKIFTKINLLITNDSGPMHIATALKTPLIALFGPTDYSETSPWVLDSSGKNIDFKKDSTQNLILLSKNLDCSPCKKRVCPLKHHNCMKELTPDLVLNYALKLLQGD